MLRPQRNIIAQVDRSNQGARSAFRVTFAIRWDVLRHRRKERLFRCCRVTDQRATPTQLINLSKDNNNKIIVGLQPCCGCAEKLWTRYGTYRPIDLSLHIYFLDFFEATNTHDWFLGVHEKRKQTWNESCGIVPYRRWYMIVIDMIDSLLNNLQPSTESSHKR